MRLSIIIPAYNSEGTILKALDSIYNQIGIGELTFEVIVIDDGSTDNTLEIVKQYSNKYNNLFVHSKSNGGVSSARNCGIRLARGEWIAFLDADDRWLSGKLVHQFGVIDKIKDVDFIGCARNGEDLKIFNRKIDSLYKATVDDLLIKMFPQTSTAIVRRSLLDKVGYYDESMSHAEDGELWVRLCNAGNFYYSPESLVVTGDGKKNFGESGLSGDLAKMHNGTLKILTYCRDREIISNFNYFMYKVFYIAKYYRRKLIVKMRS
ncbi:glycosyltransferase family 2 protein [Aeromonas veronii]|uniref:glycosyltransferase family 2 protein n=1 Tax=Aeromonas veronii TaxID=654 RepID=UPI0040557CDC